MMTILFLDWADAFYPYCSAVLGYGIAVSTTMVSMVDNQNPQGEQQVYFV